MLNAGILEPLSHISDTGSSDQPALQEWKELFDVNFFSVVQTLQFALPYLRKESKGRVVFVSSGAATKGYVGWGAYSASKAALNSLCQ